MKNEKHSRGKGGSGAGVTKDFRRGKSGSVSQESKGGAGYNNVITQDKGKKRKNQVQRKVVRPGCVAKLREGNGLKPKRPILC